MAELNTFLEIDPKVDCCDMIWSKSGQPLFHRLDRHQNRLDRAILNVPMLFPAPTYDVYLITRLPRAGNLLAVESKFCCFIQVIQQRFDGSVNFNRTWTDYEQGFGTPPGEYWLGLYNIYQFITTDGTYKLRVELEDWDGVHGYAEYDTFRLGSPSYFYPLRASGYTGDIGTVIMLIQYIVLLKELDQITFLTTRLTLTFLRFWYQ